MNKIEKDIPEEIYQKIKSIDTKLDLEFLYYIVHKIYSGKEYDVWDYPGWVRLSSKKLQRKKHNYEKYISALVENNIIKAGANYKKASSKLKFTKKKKKKNNKTIKAFPKAYKLLLTNSPSITTDVFNLDTKTKIPHKNITFTDKYFYELKPEIQKQVQILLNNVRVNKQAYLLKKSLKSLEKYRKIPKGYPDKIFEPLKKLELLKTGGTLSKTMRVFTTFTRLSSFLRYYIEIDKKELWELDLSNSQMVFLYALIQQEAPHLLNEKDVIHYRDLVVEGIFYENIEKKYKAKFPETNINRNIIKGTVLQAFFSKEVTKNGKTNNFRRNTREILKENFPTIYQFILETKRYNYKKLSRKLQLMESKVFIYDFYRVANEIKYLTAHDAVFVKGNDKDIVKKLLENIFTESFGFKPNLKLKPPKKLQINAITEKIKTKIQITKTLNSRIL